VETHGPGETKKIGEIIGGLLPPGSLITLNGDLGAGKTTFVQGLAVGIGVRDPVTSPTFNLIHEHNGRIALYHIDAYRLKDNDDVEELGFDEYFYSAGITVIEWAERIAHHIPAERLDVNIAKVPGDPEQRHIVFLPGGTVYLQLLEELKVICGC